MKISRPSPALIVSIIALIIACAGTATAASVVIIKNSRQVASGSINGGDIRNGSIAGVDIASGAVGDRQIKRESITSDKLSDGLRASFRAQGLTGTEAVRREGPGKNAANSVKTIATLKQLPAGTYLILAKTIISPDPLAPDLLRETLGNRQGASHCVVDAGGDVDHGRGKISAPGEQSPQSMNLQLTRSSEAPFDVKLICDASQEWKASDTSIVAIALQGSQRIDVTE